MSISLWRWPRGGRRNCGKVLLQTTYEYKNEQWTRTPSSTLRLGDGGNHHCRMQQRWKPIASNRKSWSKMNPLPKGVSEPHEPPTPMSWIWTVRLHRPATRAELMPLRIWAPPTRAELIPLRIWAPAQEATRSLAVGPRTCSWTAVVFPQPAPPPKATTTGRHLHSCTNTTSTISPAEPKQTPPERGQRGEDKKAKQHRFGERGS